MSEEHIERNLIQTWSMLGRWPEGRLLENPEWMAYETPIRQIPYNGVLTTHSTETSAQATIREVSALYANRKVPMVWWVTPSSHPASLDRQLIDGGFSQIATLIGMQRSLSDLQEQPRSHPTLDIRRVDSEDLLRLYTQMTARRWHAEEEEAKLFRLNQWLGVGEDDIFQRWLAFLDGRPVGKAVISVEDDVCGLYGVSTEPEAWGQGVGTAVTLAALQGGRKRGCRQAVLHSTEMAVSMYRRWGFEGDREYRVFSPSVFEAV